MVRGKNHNNMDQLTMKHFALLCLFVGLSVSAAKAVDLHDLVPCKPAAERFCERGGTTMLDLIRCGATLAAIREKVGFRCREVLRRYGQL
jgi:hypothetical protein